MKRGSSLLQKVWRKLRPAKSASAPAVAKPKAEPPPKRVSSLEPLEGRIAPAALINPTTLVYKDFDGDIVTVKFSKPLFNKNSPATDIAAQANEVFKFDTGNVVGTDFTVFDPATAVAQQLQLIDLTEAPTNTSVGNIANGISFTITAVQGSLLVEGNQVAGDGLAHVGYVKAKSTTGGLTLGTVSIAGDLGQIDAGNNSAATAIKALKVQSLGAKGLTTQAATGASLESNITGALGSLTVAGDIKDASVRVVNSFVALGRIGAVTIGGSLIGTQTVAATSDSTGLIQAASDIGAVKIGADLKGGGGATSGSIVAGGKIASVLVSGEIIGFGGAGSGAISAGTSLGPVTVLGNMTGGSGANSGVIEGETVTSVSIGGDLAAGSGAGSGLISSVDAMGAIKVSEDIEGGNTTTGINAGGILAGGKLTSVTVGGTLIGGDAALSGFITGGGDIGAIKLGGILGGEAANAGSVIAAGKIASLTVLHDIVGGRAAGAGSVFSGLDAARVGDIGAVKIGGKLEGGSEINTGLISANGKIASLTIGPAKAVDQALLKGGGGDFSGAVFSRGGLGTVKIMGHVEGGAGDFSGAIVSRDFFNTTTERAGDLGAVTVAGHVKGGTGDDSGLISADGKLTSAKIGDLSGGDGARSGALRAGQGALSLGNTGAIAITGSVFGGAGDQSGGVVAEGKIASVIVSGNAVGGTIRAGDNLGKITFVQHVDGTIISARGQEVQGKSIDLAIGKITVGGHVSNAQFLAGYDTALVAANADAQIGAVMVKGNWTASDLVAGVLDGGAAGFGTEGDVLIGGFDNTTIVSSIASIVITGTVSGTPTVGGDHFGFTAQKIGAFKADGVTQPLNKLADGQVVDLVTDEVSIREIPLPVPV